MTGQFLNLVTILSLLLCLAAAGLWARSYWPADWVVHRTLDDSDPARVRASDWMFSASRGVAHVGAWVFVWDCSRMVSRPACGALFFDQKKAPRKRGG